MPLTDARSAFVEQSAKLLEAGLFCRFGKYLKRWGTRLLTIVFARLAW